MRETLGFERKYISRKVRKANRPSFVKALPGIITEVKVNIAERAENFPMAAWEKIDKFFEKYWVAVIFFTALYLGAHIVYAIGNSIIQGVF